MVLGAGAPLESQGSMRPTKECVCPPSPPLLTLPPLPSLQSHPCSSSSVRMGDEQEDVQIGENKFISK